MAKSSLKQVEGVEESISMSATGAEAALATADAKGERPTAKITAGLAAKAAAIILDSSPFLSFHFTRAQGEGEKKTR